MLTRRLGLLVGAAVFIATVGAVSIAPSSSQAQSCSGIPGSQPILYRCNDGYSAAQCYNTEPDPYSGVCVDTTWRPDPVDPNNICVDYDTCVTGLGENIDHVRDEVGELDDPVFGYLSYVLGIVGGAVEDVNEILDQPICVQPFPPTTPICVT